MKNSIHLLAIALFLFTLNSCSDDSGTDPSDEFVGATFQLREGMEWDYNYFRLPNQNEIFDGKIYTKHKLNGELGNKQSFKREIKFVSSNSNSDAYSIVSTDDDEYSYYFDSGLGFHSIIQEQTRESWMKMIDYRNESWVQFDIQADSITPDNKEYSAIYKRYGSKVEDLEVEYKGQSYNATKYIVTFLIDVSIDGEQTLYFNTDFYMTIIEGIGIYKTERYEDSNGPYDTEVLIDHK